MVLAQMKVEDKSNEIKAISALLSTRISTSRSRLIHWNSELRISPTTTSGICVTHFTQLFGAGLIGHKAIDALTTQELNFVSKKKAIARHSLKSLTDEQVNLHE